MHESTEIAFLFAQIILSMNEIHSQHILHRDLKSQNIFLTKNKDRVKIGDFGISKILSSKSKALTVVGTPSYISPELCEGLSIYLSRLSIFCKDTNRKIRKTEFIYICGSKNISSSGIENHTQTA